MATAVIDHQPPPTTTKMGNAISRTGTAGRRISFKYDPESAMPSTDDEPEPPEPPPEPRLADSVLERIPTYLQPPIPWRDRLMHFTFAWYTVTYVSFLTS
jgi:hypothetical protein